MGVPGYSPIPLCLVYLESDSVLYMGIPGVGYNLLPRYTRRSIHGDGYSSMPGCTWSRIQPFT